MNFMLGSKTFAETGAQVIGQPTANVQPEKAPAITEAKAEYTVIDQSKTFTKDKLIVTLKLKGAPQDQLESLGGSLPGTDSWTVWFDPAGQSGQTEKAKANPAKSYMVFLNSVNGTIINAISSDDVSALKNVDLNDSSWLEKAKQSVTGLLPKNVSH